MKWLITGGCGFIGTSLVASLLEAGETDIRIIDNLSVGRCEDLGNITPYKQMSCLDNSPSGVELIVGDVTDEQLAYDVTVGVDIIVHLAANTGVKPSVDNPRQDCLVNVLGIFNYLEAARKRSIKRFLFASSGAPVGLVEPPIHEELAPHPVSPYGASKLAGEGYCSAYYQTFGVETVVLRFGNVYGPGSMKKNSVVASFFKQAMNGDDLIIYGDGSQTRDFIYIDDLIQAIWLASKQPSIGGEIFQIATNAETTVSELAENVINVLSDKGIHGVRIKHNEARPGDVKRNFSDTRKAKNVLGWQAKYSLTEGISRTFDYFKRARQEG